MKALRLIQLAVGWEWLVSGLTKLAHGDCPNGLAAQLRGMDGKSPAWFHDFLCAVVLPLALVAVPGVRKEADAVVPA